MRPATRMIRILDEEFRILTTGNYAALPFLTTRKEELCRFLNEAPDNDPEMVEALAVAAARNAGLIEAAKRGFEQARIHIREIRDGTSHATYGRSGMRRPLSRCPSRIEQKL